MFNLLQEVNLFGMSNATGYALPYFNFWLMMVQFLAPALNWIKALENFFVFSFHPPIIITPFPSSEDTKAGRRPNLNGSDGPKKIK